jgi:hypothetical protein
MTTKNHGRMIQDGSVSAANLAAGAVTLPALRRYTSTGTAWDVGDTLTFAHGLGVIPWHVQVYLVSLATEGGWVAADRLSWYGATWYADATNVYVLIGSATQTALRKDNGNAFNLTPTDWQVQVVAHG